MSLPKLPLDTNILTINNNKEKQKSQSNEK